MPMYVKNRKMQAAALARWGRMNRDQRSLVMMEVAKARNAKLSPERRSEIARMAAVARWDWARQRAAREGLKPSGG